MKGISRLTVGPANRYALHPLQNERNKPAYNRTSQQEEIRWLTLTAVTAESTSYFLMVFKKTKPHLIHIKSPPSVVDRSEQ